MAYKNFDSALKNYPLTHFPTLALLIGTFSFWFELYMIRQPSGHSSCLAWGLLILYLVAVLSRGVKININRHWKQWAKEPLAMRIIFGGTAFLGLTYLAVGLYASLLPPHLIQETDALMYHITLPRQHFLHHSFNHLQWSVPDLFSLPLDYALSPFELSTLWPNKLIQFIFFGGFLACVFDLVYLLSGQSLRRAVIGVLAVMACHGVAIQVGLAMMDLVMLYCFLACIHSFLTGRFGLAAIEFTFFFWSKSFIPLQMAVIILIMAMIIFGTSKKGFICSELPIPNRHNQKFLLFIFGVASLGIAMPYLIKSYYYTGTPLYPFGVGFLQPVAQYAPDHWHAILQRTADCLAEKDSYGHGRSIVAFIKHFWLIAVPEQGVNNVFDYPIGLVYLLVLVPFGAHVIRSLKSKKVPILSLIILIWWMTWWFGSQQSRFLLVPICLMIILVISYLPKISRVLIVLIILSLGLETISLINANRHDWGKSFSEIIREKDRKLLGLNPAENSRDVELNFPDVAFAPYPVVVRQSNSVFVIPY